jgi:hypothetical protein
MIKTKIGAQRYNNKMDKILEQANLYKIKEQARQLAQDVLENSDDHLLLDQAMSLKELININ